MYVVICKTKFQSSTISEWNLYGLTFWIILLLNGTDSFQSKTRFQFLDPIKGLQLDGKKMWELVFDLGLTTFKNQLFEGGICMNEVADMHIVGICIMLMGQFHSLLVFSGKSVNSFGIKCIVRSEWSWLTVQKSNSVGLIDPVCVGFAPWRLVVVLPIGYWINTAGICLPGMVQNFFDFFQCIAYLCIASLAKPGVSSLLEARTHIHILSRKSFPTARL